MGTPTTVTGQGQHCKAGNWPACLESIVDACREQRICAHLALQGRTYPRHHAEFSERATCLRQGRSWCWLGFKLMQLLLHSLYVFQLGKMSWLNVCTHAPSRRPGDNAPNLQVSVSEPGVLTNYQRTHCYHYSLAGPETSISSQRLN